MCLKTHTTGITTENSMKKKMIWHKTVNIDLSKMVDFHLKADDQKCTNGSIYFWSKALSFQKKHPRHKKASFDHDFILKAKQNEPHVATIPRLSLIKYIPKERNI